MRAASNVPHLAIEPDGSILASGDQSKRDLYTVQLRTGVRRITAIRLETLPDESLPRGGPGRIFYEGPPGDFFLSELRVTADGKPVPLKEASSSNPKNQKDAATAIDGDPQTGWTSAAARVASRGPCFALPARSKPRAKSRSSCSSSAITRPASAGSGSRRRATRARSPQVRFRSKLSRCCSWRRPHGNRARSIACAQYYLTIAPELAEERAAIAQLEKQMPRYPTTLVMKERPPENPRPTFVHRRGEFLQPSERVQPAVLSMLAPHVPEGSRATGSAWRAGSFRVPNPVDGPGDHESPVGGVLRPGAGADGRGFRLPGRAADASRAAGLAGGRDWSKTAGR